MNWFVNRHCTEKAKKDEPPAPAVPKQQEPVVEKETKPKPKPKYRRSRVRDMLGVDGAAD